MKSLLISLIRAYQRTLSPETGIMTAVLFGNRPTCVFYPSCSSYAAEAIARHGAITGVVLGARRLSRCHPWHMPAFDPVK